MRVLIQRVSRAAVHVDGRPVGAIQRGCLLLVGIREGDEPELLEPMARKIVNLRLFPDPEGRSHFDRSLLEEKADLLVVSQFTLYGSCRKGRRPSFSDAARPQKAEEMFNRFVQSLRTYPLRVETGAFGALMEVSLVNDGPVSLWLDSDEILPGRGRGDP